MDFMKGFLELMNQLIDKNVLLNNQWLKVRDTLELMYFLFSAAFSQLKGDGGQRADSKPWFMSSFTRVHLVEPGSEGVPEKQE